MTFHVLFCISLPKVFHMRLKTLTDIGLLDLFGLIWTICGHLESGQGRITGWSQH